MFCENGINLVREGQTTMINSYNLKLVEEITKEINSDAKKLVKITKYNIFIIFL